jgi:hypothetical protein
MKKKTYKIGINVFAWGKLQPITTNRFKIKERRLFLNNFTTEIAIGLRFSPLKRG